VGLGIRMCMIGHYYITGFYSRVLKLLSELWTHQNRQSQFLLIHRVVRSETASLTSSTALLLSIRRWALLSLVQLIADKVPGIPICYVFVHCLLHCSSSNSIFIPSSDAVFLTDHHQTMFKLEQKAILKNWFWNPRWYLFLTNISEGYFFIS
jgi:hypothetical protein